MKTCIFLVIAFLGMACGSKSTMSVAENTSAGSESDSSEPKVLPVLLAEDLPNDSGDAYAIRQTSVYGSVLEIVLTYGGGCEAHEFVLMTTGAVMKSMPPQMEIVLHHNANGDMCRALVTDTVRFELEPVKPQGNGSLILRLQDYNDRIVYNY